MTKRIIAAMLVGLLGTAALADDVPRFEIEASWPKPLPNNWILGQVSGLATDRQDRIWVVHRPNSLTERERAAEQNPPPGKCCVAAPPVLVFDQSGNLIRSWGGPAQGYQWPESEHGIFVDDSDFVWLAGNGKKDGQLLKFTMDGKFVLQIGKQGQGNDSNSTERLALLWQILSGAGFPNQFFNDSWVVGFWRADHGRYNVELGRRASRMAQAVLGSPGP